MAQFRKLIHRMRLPGVFAILRAVWRIFPESWRGARLQRRLARAARSALDYRGPDLYDSRYFSGIVDPAAVSAAPVVTDTIVRDLNPRTLLDVGCGTGAIMAGLSERGVRVTGVDYSRAALAVCRERGLEVRAIDLERDTLPAPEVPYDVVLCAEVAEHLPKQVADQFVATLASQGSTIVLTAATPGQGGIGHVNEQPHSYWVKKLQARGFALDEQLTQAWRREWSASPLVAPWYAANVMVFSRQRERPEGQSVR